MINIDTAVMALEGLLFKRDQPHTMTPEDFEAIDVVLRWQEKAGSEANSAYQEGYNDGLAEG